MDIRNLPKSTALLPSTDCGKNSKFIAGLQIGNEGWKEGRLRRDFRAALLLVPSSHAGTPAL
eukprot:1160345-Pelagomonas_calceolata.AAC.3